MEAHGGYLCRIEDFGDEDIVGLARAAALASGLDTADAGLQISQFPKKKVVRFAFDSPRVYGSRGAHFYGKRHALAVALSEVFRTTVHAYVYDPEEVELVASYAAGKHVGGETLRYEDAAGIDDGRMSDEEFEDLQNDWPLGRLAKVFGVTRNELLSLPRSPSQLLDLAAWTPTGVEAPRLEER